MRRLLLTTSVLLLVGLFAWAGAQSGVTQVAGSPPVATPYPTVTSDLTLAATGDSIILRPVSVYEGDPAFKGIVDLIRSATVAFTNFELSVFDTRTFTPIPQAEYGGLWLQGTKKQAEDLKWMGFDVVARANNHTTDYGVEGMHETDAILDEVGLLHAGSGETLGQARAPAYFQTAAGRVAMISVASSFSPSARAMDPRPDIKGRPGLNALRWSRQLYLEPEEFARFRKIAEEQFKIPKPATVQPDQFSLFGTSIRKGEKSRAELVADPRDVAAMVAQVKSARRQADFVVVTIHAHEPGNFSDTPADFLPGFARAMIDAGADMFIGHGPHRLRGIELYKGRPIFYSLGNFMYQCYTLEPQAADVYESTSPKLNPLESTIADLYDARPNGFGSNVNEEVWWQGAIAVAKFAPGRLVSVELHPIELGYGTPRAQIGTPRLATPAVGKKIIDRLNELSKPFGTTIDMVQNVGVLRLNLASTNQ